MHVPISDIIEKERVVIYFQPLLSIARRSIVGYEALSRGIDEDGTIIPPCELFKEAGEKDLLLELDRLCRKKALEKFYPLYAKNPNLVVSINIESSILRKNIIGSNNLYHAAQESGVPSENIIIEILESEVKNISVLQEFTQRYKSYGFTIAMDDVGKGSSNLERVIFIKPDILKLDRSLVNEISHDFFRQEILRALINVSHRIGALVLAEGIENQDDVIACLNCGCDLLQGYYFMRPAEDPFHDIDALYSSISMIGSLFRKQVLVRIRERQDERKKYDDILHNISQKMMALPLDEFDRAAGKAIGDYYEIDGIYTLNETGMQVTSTIMRENRKRKAFFEADKKGTDQSCKDYFYSLMAGLSTYVSDLYISSANGELCKTISTKFRNRDLKEYVLCIDVVHS